MNRSRDYYRYQREQHINRKIGILKRYQNEGFYEGHARIKGKLSKGKIHCSCWMCRKKSYDELSHSDKIKNLKQISQLNDYYTG